MPFPCSVYFPKRFGDSLECREAAVDPVAMGRFKGHTTLLT